MGTITSNRCVQTCGKYFLYKYKKNKKYIYYDRMMVFFHRSRIVCYWSLNKMYNT